MEKIYLAQNQIGGPFEGLGPLGETSKFRLGSGEAAAALFNNVITLVIGIMTVIAGIWFIFLFITGAIGWLGAGGDKAKVQEAQKRITNGIIGLAVTISAVFIIDLIGTLLGFDILSPGDLFLNIAPK